MILQTFTSILYNFVVLTSFVNGYIYFAAHLDDLENVAKRLRASEGLPIERAKTIVHEPKDEIRVDYYEELDTVLRDYRNAPGDPEVETGIKKEQPRKVLVHETNIDELAKQIKDRVLKELTQEFIRLKKKRKQSGQRGRHAKQRKEKIASKHHYVSDVNEEERVLPTTPKANANKREKHVRPFEEEPIMPSTKKLLKRPLNTKPRMNTTPKISMTPKIITTPKISIEEEATEKPIIVRSDEIEVEKIDLGTKSNDSYEYYEAPPRDDVVFEPVEETPARATTIKPSNMARYKIQSNDEVPVTARHRPQVKIDHRPMKPIYVAANVDEPVLMQDDSNLKVKGNDDTYILYDVASEEDLRLTQETTPRTTHRITPKVIKITKQRFSMTSPDYYASLPTVAERYDFNEPIPSKDRVRSI